MVLHVCQWRARAWAQTRARPQPLLVVWCHSPSAAVNRVVPIDDTAACSRMGASEDSPLPQPIEWCFCLLMTQLRARAWAQAMDLPLPQLVRGSSDCARPMSHARLNAR